MSRVRVPSSTPPKTLGFPAIPRVFSWFPAVVGIFSFNRFLPEIDSRVTLLPKVGARVGARKLSLPSVPVAFIRSDGRGLAA